MTTQTQTNSAISCIKFDGYKIELLTNLKGKPVARLSKLLTVGKNKGSWKLLDGYYFNDEERRKEWIEERIKTIKGRLQDNAQSKIAKKEAVSNHDFKVGEILYDSWGYEQTNIDFYQIIEVKPKSVVLQPIGSRMVEGGKESGMSSNVAPDPSFKDGDPILKPVRVYFWDRNKKIPTYTVKSKHGSISRYTYGEKGVYSSWYA